MSRFTVNDRVVYEDGERFYTFASEYTAEAICKKLNEVHEVSDATVIYCWEPEEGYVIPVAVFNELRQRYKKLKPTTKAGCG